MIRVDGIRSELKLRLEKVKESLRSHDEVGAKTKMNSCANGLRVSAPPQNL